MKCLLEKNCTIEEKGKFFEKDCTNQSRCCENCGYEDCHEGCDKFEYLGCSCKECSCSCSNFKWILINLSSSIKKFLRIN